MRSYPLFETNRSFGAASSSIRYDRIPKLNRTVGLICGDSLIVVFAIISAYIFRIGVYEGTPIEFSVLVERISILAPAAVIAHILFFYIFELYDHKVSERIDLKTLIWITLSVVMATAAIVFLVFLFPHHKMGRVLVAFHIPITILFTFTWRWAFAKSLPAQYYKKNLIWCDYSANNREAISKLAEKSFADYHWLGEVSDCKEPHKPVRLNTEEVYPNFYGLLSQRNINTLVLSENPKGAPALKNFLIDCKFKGVEIYDFPTFYGKVFGKVPVSRIKGSYFIFSHQNRSLQPYVFLKVKRLFDLIASTLGLLSLSPLMAACAIAIKTTSKGPVFFTQERLGLNEKPFTLIKFRTMVVDAESACGPKWSCRNDPRITAVGQFLRKTRLDEIPQLINVLKGEMSLVGPRPIRRHFADLLAKTYPFYRLRFNVKPGLTGWAQVKGDYGGTMEGQLEKLEYELYYIQNRNFFLDLFILVKTIQTILFRPGE